VVVGGGQGFPPGGVTTGGVTTGGFRRFQNRREGDWRSNDWRFVQLEIKGEIMPRRARLRSESL